MLQKLRFDPGFNKQVTATGVRVNGEVETMYVLDMELLKK